MIEVNTQKNYKAIKRAYNGNFQGIVLEGGSRSGKTFDALMFIVRLAILTTNHPLLILFIKQSLIGLKATLYKDLEAVFNMFKLPTDVFNKSATEFRLNGHTFAFAGADSWEKYKGYTTDILFINEANDVPEMVFQQLKTRNKRFIILDLNPDRADSWVYDLADNNPNFAHLKSTYIDNKFCPINSKKTIESYEPTEINIANGTADKFMWEVYGLGLRTAGENLVFKNWDIVTELPTTEYTIFGGDFGYSNSMNAIIEARVDGHNLYLRQHLYKNGMLNVEIAEAIKSAGLENELIVFDRAEVKSIQELRAFGCNCVPCDPKSPGDVVFGIEKIKSFKIHIDANSADLINEFKNYRWSKDRMGNQRRDQSGRPIPEKENDHLIDALRYAMIYHSYLLPK